MSGTITRWIDICRLRLRSLLRSGHIERELDEELRYHFERLVEENRAAGMSPQDARYAALRALGPVESRKEECRDARGLALLNSVRQDVVYAFRTMRKAPAFTAVAILSLAFGIGANTTIFSFVNAVLLRPLPYPGSERLVVLRERPLASQGTVNVHPVNYVAWRARATSFEALALTQAPALNILVNSRAEQIPRVQTTSDIFKVFGLTILLGREFTEEDTRPGAPPVVILAHGFWQRAFGGDPSVLGRSLAIPDGSLTIVGVAPAGLRIGLVDPDVYTPTTLDPADPGATGSRAFQVYGRLKSRVTLDQARAEMATIAGDLSRQLPLDKDMGVVVASLHDDLVNDARPALRLLMAVVATVLLIACVNLASLLMARGISRRGELALRASLGASRGRIVRQLVVESLALSSLGGVAGLALAELATRALVSLSAGALSAGTADPVRLDALCLTFTLCVSMLTAVIFGLVPAWQASHVDPQTALRERARGASADRRQHRLRAALVMTEVALAVVLLIGAGLLLRTFSNLVSVNLGFQPAQTFAMNLFLGLRPPEVRVNVIDQILDRVEAVPGVSATGTIQFLPLSGMACATGVWLDGRPAADATAAAPTECALVSRGYFAAMGIPVVEGRAFDKQDRFGGPRVLIVNQSFARRYFKDGRALGRRLLVQASNQGVAEVVGVVGDIRHGLTSEPAPTVYLLHDQTPGYIMSLVVRSSGEMSAQTSAIRRAIHDVDPSQAVAAAKSIEQYVAESLARPKLYAVLVACFAVIAMMLAAIGVYGLVAYVVSQRTHEIGIRLALGATGRTVFGELVSRGAWLVGAGVAIGLAAAVLLRGAASTLLFGITPGDPLTYVVAAAAFGIVAVAAVMIPARRASRIDPIVALRHE